MKQIKKCATCEKVFEKKINCSRKNWLLTDYCSRSCAKKGKAPWNKDKVGVMPIPWNKGWNNFVRKLPQGIS